MSTPDLRDLQRFIEKWGHPTHEGRLSEHLTSSFEELAAFHRAFTPRLRELMGFLDQFPVDAIPQEHMPLCYTLLALIETDDPVNNWGNVSVPNMADPREWTKKTSFYDNATPREGNGEFLPYKPRKEEIAGERTAMAWR